MLFKYLDFILMLIAEMSVVVCGTDTHMCNCIIVLRTLLSVLLSYFNNNNSKTFGAIKLILPSHLKKVNLDDK